MDIKVPAPKSGGLSLFLKVPRGRQRELIPTNYALTYTHVYAACTYTHECVYALMGAHAHTHRQTRHNKWNF